MPFLPVPYSFNDDELPIPRTSETPGQFHGVHFTIADTRNDFVMSRIHLWFANRGEIILVDEGIAQKSGLFFAVLEWEGCEIDPLFLKILEHEPDIIDYSVYNRDAVYEEEI